MKKILVLLIGVVCCFATSVSSLAQEANYDNLIIDRQASYRYTVVVLDNQGEPIAGASIVLKGTTTGTITDIDGKATFDAAPGTVIVVSFIGFRTQEITLTDKRTFVIVLQE